MFNAEYRNAESGDQTEPRNAEPSNANGGDQTDPISAAPRNADPSNADRVEVAGAAGIPPIIHSANLGAPAYGVARHLVLGDRPVLRLTIANLHKRGYAEPNDWSKPLPTGRDDEYMVILTKPVPLD